MLIKKRKTVGLKHYNEPKDFIEYLNDIGNIYKNIDEYNLNKKCKTLIVFDDMIADILSCKKLKRIIVREEKEAFFFCTKKLH